MVNLTLDASSMQTDLSLAMLLERKYHRIDPLLPRNFPLDSYKDIPELIEIAGRFRTRRAHSDTPSHALHHSCAHSARPFSTSNSAPALPGCTPQVGSICRTPQPS